MFTYFALSSTAVNMKRIVAKLLITYAVQQEDTNETLSFIYVCATAVNF
jgi:hypothetical protein